VERDLKPYRRLAVAQAILLGFALLIVGQLVRWQVFQHRSLSKGMAVGPGWDVSGASGEVLSQRGVLLDRNHSILALNNYDYTIFAAPNQISESDTAEVAGQLAVILERPADELISLLAGDGLYAQIDRQIPREAGKAILALDLPGIYVQPVAVRVYPEHTLAAHTLGFVAGDAEQVTKGYYGVEGYYDKMLKGKAGLPKDRWDPWQRLGLPQPFLFDDGGADEAGGGGVSLVGPTLVLTLDKTIQYLVEQELRDAVERYGAEGGCIVVLDPKTGALLAVASYPTYDPSRFAEIDEKRFIDPVIGRQYEPGSTFKVVTMAAALEAGVVRPDDVYNDIGYIEVGGRTFRNWDEKAYGMVTMTDVLVHSLNTGISHVSTLLEPSRFYHYVDRFGFGRKLGVDLEGEVDGMVRQQGDPEWHESDLGTNSFGQGLAVTPLQMVSAVGAIANRGFLMRPYVAAQMIHADSTSAGMLSLVGDPSGDALAVVDAKQVVLRQVISERTARTVTEMMEQAVERGAPMARVQGYRIAGKTGTAQTPIVGGYDPSLTIASFVGFAPVDDPQFVVLVKLDKPTTSPWGAVTAAPTFANIARILFTQLAIPPDQTAVVPGVP
jgi:cell division protein FtsI/penicillin-binding protein 2